MGQTTSSSQVDYTFGLVNDNSKSDKSILATSYKVSKVDHDDIYSTYIGERLLLYPQQYGLDNHVESDDPNSDASSAVEKRLSTPSTSSGCSLYFQHVQQTPFYIRASNLKHQQQQYIDRIDSGYAADQDVFEPNKVGHYHLDTRLAQDIQYVDQLYYTNSRSRQQKRITNASSLMDDIVGASPDHGDDDITIGTKLTFAAAALASQDSSMRDICLSRRSLISVSPNIGLLACIRKLNLSNNQLVDMPDSIGQLKQLEILLISKNYLQRLPDSMKYLTKLTELDLSYNQLQSLPFLGHLSSLHTLVLSHNRLSSLPSDLAGMKQLVTMDLTKNPISVLPAEITRLSNLRRLRLDHCLNLLNYEEHQPLEMELAHNPPSLVELCARKVVLSLSSSSSSSSPTTTRYHRLFGSRSKSQQPSPPVITMDKLCRLTTRTLSYLSSANTCSSCHGPYFESCVIRRRLIEKNSLWIPLEYHLCSAHWSDENDRLLNMFHHETSPYESKDSIATTLTVLHSLIIKKQLDHQRLSSTPSTSDLDYLESKSSGTFAFVRHPQQLQSVANRNPSSFLIHNTHHGGRQ